MAESLATDPDFVSEQYRGGEGQARVAEIPGGTSISSLNGLSGPSVTIGGGTTGMSFSTSAPNITLGGTLAVANGGTGATTAAGARTNLGLGTMATANAVAPVADLNQTISATPTQGEVQTLSDKVDELLAAMRTAAHLTP